MPLYNDVVQPILIVILMTMPLFPLSSISAFYPKIRIYMFLGIRYKSQVKDNGS